MLSAQFTCASPPIREHGIAPGDVLHRVAVQILVRYPHRVVVASIQGDVDGVAKGAHWFRGYVFILAAFDPLMVTRASTLMVMRIQADEYSRTSPTRSVRSGSRQRWPGCP